MNTIILWILIGFAAGFLVEYLVDLFWWRRKLRRENERAANYESLLQDQNDEMDHLRAHMSKVDRSLDEHEAYIRQLEYELDGARLQLSDMRVQHEAADARSRQAQSDANALRKQIKQQGTSTGVADSETQRKMNRYKKALQDAYTENKRLTAALESRDASLLAASNGRGKRHITNHGISSTTEAYKSLNDGYGDQLEDISGIGAVYADRLRAAGIRTFADLSRMRSERLTDIIQPQKWQRIEPERWIAEAADRAIGNGGAAEL